MVLGRERRVVRGPLKLGPGLNNALGLEFHQASVRHRACDGVCRSAGRGFASARRCSGRSRRGRLSGTRSTLEATPGSSRFTRVASSSRRFLTTRDGWAFQIQFQAISMRRCNHTLIVALEIITWNPGDAVESTRSASATPTTTVAKPMTRSAVARARSIQAPIARAPLTDGQSTAQLSETMHTVGGGRSQRAPSSCTTPNRGRLRSSPARQIILADGGHRNDPYTIKGVAARYRGRDSAKFRVPRIWSVPGSQADSLAEPRNLENVQDVGATRSRHVRPDLRSSMSLPERLHQIAVAKNSAPSSPYRKRISSRRGLIATFSR